MDDPSDNHHQSQFTSTDLARLKSIVKGVAGGNLSDADLDDVAGEILLSACVTTANANNTVPLAALAYSYAKHTSYYEAARLRANELVDPTIHQWSDPTASTSTLSVEVRNTLASIPPVSRTMIWLHDLEGLTLAETAEALGMSTTTAYRRLSRAHDEFKAAWSA